ncbi:MAG: kinase-like domain-containing protein [Piptocephalis tieghemiana]|nr:MAG: kinase-like domain-containing protein [Piptocephalis tieghemiana]
MEREFHWIKVLGKGSFAEVFHVRGRRDGKDYAIKRSVRPYTGVSDRKRQIMEVEALWRMQQGGGKEGKGSRYIVQLISAWEEEAVLYLQMETYERGNLGDWLLKQGRERGAMGEEGVWRVVGQVGHALAWVHQCGYLHLDVKPANCMLTRKWTVRLGDFGHALPQSEDPHVGWGGDEGDKEYVAPEVIRRGLYLPAADVFSLGMSMLEMVLNIVLPAEGEVWERFREGDFSDCEVAEAGRSGEVLGVMWGLMCPDPADRTTLEGLLGVREVVRGLEEVEARERSEKEGEGIDGP